MTEITKKFRVLEDGKYRIAVKVSGGSRLSEILLGDAQIDFGFVRSISGGALFLSDIITASRGKEIFFKILSDSATFVASEFRTFFRAIDTNIKFQDIVAEEYKEADPGGGGDEPPDEPPEEPEVDYGPELTPNSWYPSYTRYNFTSNTLDITIPNNGVYKIVICLAEPYFIESTTMTGGNQFNPTASNVTNITGWVKNSARYYYNSVDSVINEQVFDYVSKITIKINTSDSKAPYRGSAVMLKRLRDLDVYTPYINRVFSGSGSFNHKHYIGSDGSSIAEGLELTISDNRSCRLVAFRLDDDIKAETSIPDANKLMVVRYGSSSAAPPYKFNAAGTNMWPAKGTVNILARKAGSDENMYFRWISREVIMGNDQKTKYGTCVAYRTGSVSKYEIDSSTGKVMTVDITNPATGKSESVKIPNGLTPTVYGYARILPCGRIFTCRRIKISNSYDLTDELQTWRNNPPVNILDLASDAIKKSPTAVIVVEMVQSANSKNYDSATNTFRIHSSGRQGRLFVSPYADGEDGIDYAAIGTVKEYQKYVQNRLVKTADGKRYETIWNQVDYNTSYHRMFFNVTTANTDGSVIGTTISNPWFVLDNDPSRVYHFVGMTNIFRDGGYNANAAKRLIAYPSPGMDIYISMLDFTPADVLSSTSKPLALPVRLS